MIEACDYLLDDNCSFDQVSIKHLHSYLSEVQFRGDRRRAEQIFVLVIATLVVGSALPYAVLN